MPPSLFPPPARPPARQPACPPACQPPPYPSPFLSHPLSLPVPSPPPPAPPTDRRAPFLVPPRLLAAPCATANDPTPPISLPPFPPSPRRHRPVRPGGIDNDTMQVPRHRDAWRWFPPFTRAGEPGQPRAAVRACARQCVYTTRASEKE